MGGLGSAKMERVSEVLQLSVIIQRSGPLPLEPELSQELDFLFGSIATERRITEEFLEPWLFLFQGWFGFHFNKREALRVPRSYSLVQDNFHTKSHKITAPGFNQRIHESDAVFNRHAENIRIQKLKGDDPHLFKAAATESSDQAEPVFTLQFLFSNSLDHVQESLCN